MKRVRESAKPDETTSTSTYDTVGLKGILDGFPLTFKHRLVEGRVEVNGGPHSQVNVGVLNGLHNEGRLFVLTLESAERQRKQAMKRTHLVAV